LNTQHSPEKYEFKAKVEQHNIFTTNRS